MRKKHIFLLGILLLALSGCNSKSASEQADKETTDLSLISEENTSFENVSDSENASDKFSRIAVTFYGDTETQMGLSWYTPYKDGYGNDVEVTEKATLKKIDVKYEVQFGKAEYDENSMYHQTVLKGLTKNTEYYFRVGDTASNEWSSYGSFKTGSSDIKDFSFVAVTDTQSEHLPDAYFSAATMKMALETAQNPAFIMHSGDFVDDGSKEALWMAQMNSANDILTNNIIAPAVGNHEANDHAFWQHFMLEKTNTHKTTGLYYSYDYGNVHFVCLDTNKTNADGTSYIDDEQLSWLDSDLQKARENGTEWIIVNMHKGLYTVGEHADNEKFAGKTGARLRVGSIFEKYGVNLVVQGHDHCPSVTKPIKAGQVSDDGVIYINTGSAGSKSYELENNMIQDYYELFDYYAEGERVKDTYQDFAVVTVSENSLKVVMYEVNHMKTENQMYILHQFEIEK